MLRFTPNFAIEQHLGCAAYNARLTGINTSFSLESLVNGYRESTNRIGRSLLGGGEVGPGFFLHYDGLDSSFTSISSCPILPSLPRAIRCLTYP